MHMGGGSPDTPPWVAHLPLSDPRCIAARDECIAFAKAHEASQAAVSYYFQFHYGWFTYWYFLAMIGIFLFFRFFTKWSDWRRSASRRGESTTMMEKTVAAFRFVAYRRFRGRRLESLGLPSLGLLVFFLIGALYLFVLTFAAHPYYRLHRGYGSPPLAVRTGLMAAACTPFIIALSGKANIVSLLTGIGHEKLNVVHRWVAWACLALSVAHTIPFIVAPLRDGGYAALRTQFYGAGALEYTGTPALGMLFGLVVFSLPWIRRRFYESFYWLHIAMGVVYVGLCFWHFDNIIDSWAYLWATVALWLASLFARTFWKNRATNIILSPLEGFDTKLKILPGGMTRVDVVSPFNFYWKPGQHCFLRFPSIGILDSHPFTIATAMESVSLNPDEEKADSDCCIAPWMSFFSRSHAGFTRKLFDSVDKDCRTNVWIDGPYGGIDRDIVNAFDKLVLIVGGTGITVALPWIQHVVALRASAPKSPRLGQVKLVWVARRAEHFSWIAEELHTVWKVSPQNALEFDFYVSQGSRRDQAGASPTSSDIESAHDSNEDIVCADKSYTADERISEIGNMHCGRPCIAEVISGLRLGKRTFILGCGPQSLKTDLSNACADAQSRVISGEAEEVALFTESFEW